MIEVVNIPVMKYTTENGEPTCCLSFATGDYCKFLGARHMGTEEVCLLNGEHIFRRDHEDGRKGAGFTIPCKDCFVRNIIVG